MAHGSESSGCRVDPTMKRLLHLHVGPPLHSEPPDLSEQSGMQAVDGWHLKVREWRVAAELAAEKSSLWF